MSDSLFRSLAAASVARGCVGAWLDGGCFRRGLGGLRRGLLLPNNCRPPVELINFRAKDATMMDPGGETLPGASLGVWGTMDNSQEKPVPAKFARAVEVPYERARTYLALPPHWVTPAFTIVALHLDVFGARTLCR